MVPCPACGMMIPPDRKGEWFQCRECGCWLCLRVNSRNNNTWLEPGIRVNDVIMPIQIPNTTPARLGRPVAQSSLPDRSFPVEPMTLEAVRTTRQKIAAQLRFLEAELKRLAGMMSANRENVDTILNIKTDMDRLAREKALLTDNDNELQGREADLLAEMEQGTAGVSSPGRHGGWAFGCSVALVAAALVIFANMLNMPWTVTAVLWIMGISFAGGIVFMIGYYVLR